MMTTKDHMRQMLVGYAGLHPESKATCAEAVRACISQAERHNAYSPVHNIARVMAKFIDELEAAE